MRKKRYRKRRKRNWIEQTINKFAVFQTNTFWACILRSNKSFNACARPCQQNKTMPQRSAHTQNARTRMGWEQTNKPSIQWFQTIVFGITLLLPMAHSSLTLGLAKQNMPHQNGETTPGQLNHTTTIDVCQILNCRENILKHDWGHENKKLKLFRP